MTTRINSSDIQSLRDIHLKKTGKEISETEARQLAELVFNMTRLTLPFKINKNVK